MTSDSERIGKFSLLNSYLPYYRLEQDGFRVIRAMPKTLAGMLERGEIDFSPVPSVYYLKNKATLQRYEFCIAAARSVWSVILVSKGAPLGENGGSIAVTNQTTTSAKLLEIILQERGLRHQIVPVNESTATALLEHCPYALVIGDAAIRARQRYRVVMDLGEAWLDVTGLPMVFGIAVARKGRDMAGVSAALQESVVWGKEHVDVIIGAAHEQFGLPEEFLECYFNALTYQMGERERRGLARFEEKCHEYGIL
ncbi:MAG TPA: futalosine synthase [Methanomicrobia archaeon]|nr:futalosine synthase [Methanomicrobia archaeon]